MTMYSIQLKHVNAKIDQFHLKDITLDIPKGAIIGLLGKNGAGKSTLFKTLLGTHLLYEGEMLLNDLSYKQKEIAIRSQLAIVHDTINVNPFTKGKRLLKYNKAYYKDFDEAYFRQMAERLNVPLNVRVQKMSLGMQKKLMLLVALATKPKILLLDEPFIGIDPIDKKQMIAEVQAYMEDETNTVMISSHYVEDLEKIADYIVIIDDGKIKLFEDKEKLLSQYVYVKLEIDSAYVESLVYKKESAQHIEGLMTQTDAEQLNLPYTRPSLEEIFIQMSQSEVTI